MLVFAGTPSIHENPLGLTIDGSPVETVPQFLFAIVDLVLLIAMPIIVVFIVYAGFLFVTAGDNMRKTETAKTVITWTLVGAAVLLGSKVIAEALKATILDLK
jgi:hypothetical protein